MFERHSAARARFFAEDNAGRRIAARIAMIATTTRSSMSVNPPPPRSKTPTILFSFHTPPFEGHRFSIRNSNHPPGFFVASAEQLKSFCFPETLRANGNSATARTPFPGFSNAARHPNHAKASSASCPAQSGIAFSMLPADSFMSNKFIVRFGITDAADRSAPNSDISCYLLSLCIFFSTRPKATCKVLS
jgi:hypothetical protein